jgi:hypothetical protein
VADVVVDGVSVGAVASYTFSNITATHTISATFAINTYTITASAGAGGVIMPPSAQTVSYGSTVSYALVPQPGYRIDSVIVDGHPAGPSGSSASGYDFVNVTADHSISVTFTLLSAPGIVALAPAPNSSVNALTVDYWLERPVLAGSIVATRSGGSADSGSPHVYLFADYDRVGGSHSVNVGFSLVNGAVYDIAITAADQSGTGHANISNVTYYSSVMLINSPSANSYVSTADVSYTLNQPITGGDLVVSRTGGQSDPAAPYRYTLSGAELAAGSHAVAPGFALVNGTIYSFSAENVVDAGGSPATAAAITGVTFYDAQTIAISYAVPAPKSVVTSADVSYALSRGALSGIIAFTWTGGATDSVPSHVYTLAAADLTQGSHTVTTGFPLVAGAFYTVTFLFGDGLSPAATTLSNALVYYEPAAGSLPAGDLDKNGVVDSADVQLLEAALNARPGDATWNPRGDLDGNSVIDQQDLLLIRKAAGL